MGQLSSPNLTIPDDDELAKQVLAKVEAATMALRKSPLNPKFPDGLGPPIPPAAKRKVDRDQISSPTLLSVSISGSLEERLKANPCRLEKKFRPSLWISNRPSRFLLRLPRICSTILSSILETLQFQVRNAANCCLLDQEAIHQETPESYSQKRRNTHQADRVYGPPPPTAETRRSTATGARSSAALAAR